MCIQHNLYRIFSDFEKQLPLANIDRKDVASFVDSFKKSTTLYSWLLFILLVYIGLK